MFYDVGGASVGQGVVELRIFLEMSCASDHVEEESSCFLGGSRGRVDIDLVFAIVGTKLHDVAFVGDHVHEFILVEQTFYRMIVFATFFADLY